MCEIGKFLHKSLIFWGTFNKRQNETVYGVLWFWSLNQTTRDCFVQNPPPPPPLTLPGQNCLQMPYLNMIFYRRILCVINECCRKWKCHLLVLLLLLGYTAQKPSFTVNFPKWWKTEKFNITPTFSDIWKRMANSPFTFSGSRSFSVTDSVMMLVGLIGTLTLIDI